MDKARFDVMSMLAWCDLELLSWEIVPCSSHPLRLEFEDICMFTFQSVDLMFQSRQSYQVT